jgi:ribosomal protein S12 methylthiotransferase
MRKGEIDIITLGCSKNLVDAERLMRQLELAGYRCVHDSATPKGEIAIINTCGFIGDAKEESIEMILQFAERKSHRQLRKLYVMGCLSQRYAKELPAEIPEVDGWFGKFDYMGIVNEVAKENQLAQSKTYERTLTTPSHYTYLKIAEGCNRYCSYCAIPLITGKFTSRPKEEILDEVRWLVAKGVKEFNVIAQDLSSYGLDLYGEHRLAELIDAMAQIQGVEWIRLHYAYPTDFPYDILPVMAKHPNVCKYMDIALQHCSTDVLTKMRRHITREEQDTLIERIRQEVPGICIRTTLMVGFPGETEEDFNELMEFTRQARFDRMGAFAYCEEEGTFAANNYEDDVPEEVKQERLDRLMLLQEGISAELCAEKVGNSYKVVVDRKEGDYYIGRTEHDSPEVDCEVLIHQNEGDLQFGNFYNVTITAAEEYDLYGTLSAAQ